MEVVFASVRNRSAARVKVVHVFVKLALLLKRFRLDSHVSFELGLVSPADEDQEINREAVRESERLLLHEGLHFLDRQRTFPYFKAVLSQRTIGRCMIPHPLGGVQSCNAVTIAGCRLQSIDDGVAEP
jgi:hypothetical protein